MKTEGFKLYHYLIFITVTFIIFLLCVCVGSVGITPVEVFKAFAGAIAPNGHPLDVSGRIIASIRTPRVICAALMGAALSLCGGAMQGLLKNPLADGSTLGVSSGASLGAVLAIWLGLKIPGLYGIAVMPIAVLTAFLSLAFILSLANKLDYSLSTNTIILTGVIFSMFANSLISLMISFSGDRIRPIIFWTMGSLTDASYKYVLILLLTLAICSVIILRFQTELNSFAIGEENAKHIGVDIKRVKLTVLISVSALIGICVSVGGTIGFVGLVVPHMTRMVTGPNHKRLLPASLFFGACFLMLADLLCRTLLSPRELPIGVITSLAGSVLFVYIFYKTKKIS